MTGEIKLQRGHSDEWIYTIHLYGEALDDDGGSARAEFVADIEVANVGERDCERKMVRR